MNPWHDSMQSMQHYAWAFEKHFRRKRFELLVNRDERSITILCEGRQVPVDPKKWVALSECLRGHPSKLHQWAMRCMPTAWRRQLAFNTLAGLTGTLWRAQRVDRLSLLTFDQMVGKTQLHDRPA